MRFFGFMTGIGLLVILLFTTGVFNSFTDQKASPKSHRQNAEKASSLPNTQSGTVNGSVRHRVVNSPVAKIARKDNDSKTSEIKRIVSSKIRALTAPLEHKASGIRKSSKPNVVGSEAELSSALTTQSHTISQKLKKESLAVKLNKIQPVITVDNNPKQKEKVRWHSFWGPFRTRISAAGFAENLAQRAEIKFEVIERKPGEFMVAFPFYNETDRQSKVTLIEQRTALEITTH